METMENAMGKYIRRGSPPLIKGSEEGDTDDGVLFGEGREKEKKEKKEKKKPAKMTK